METASSKTETTSYPATSAGARRAGMTEQEWRAAIKFDGPTRRSSDLAGLS